LRDAAGKKVGTVELLEKPNGLLIHAAFEALPPGVHAFHIHETADRIACGVIESTNNVHGRADR